MPDCWANGDIVQRGKSAFARPTPRASFVCKLHRFLKIFSLESMCLFFRQYIVGPTKLWYCRSLTVTTTGLVACAITNHLPSACVAQSCLVSAFKSSGNNVKFSCTPSCKPLLLYMPGRIEHVIGEVSCSTASVDQCCTQFFLSCFTMQQHQADRSSVPYQDA